MTGKQFSNNSTLSKNRNEIEEVCVPLVTNKWWAFPQLRKKNEKRFVVGTFGPRCQPNTKQLSPTRNHFIVMSNPQPISNCSREEL